MSGPLGSSQWMYASGYEIEQSLRYEDGNSPSLQFVPASAGNRRTWTYSTWFKRGNVNSSATRGMLLSAYENSSNYTYIGFDDGGGGYDRLRVYSLESSQVKIDFESSAQFRDASGWYHVVVAVDTTQGTSGNRVKIYVNGEQVTAWATSTEPSQNYDTVVSKNIRHNIGNYVQSSSFYDGYLAEVNFIDGQQLTPSSFGETGTYGEWKPKEYSGTYGTNGFYLPFKNDYTVEGFSATVWKNAAPMYVGGVGFKADLIWTKSRGTQGHAISDIITGFDRYGQTDNTNDFYTPAEIDQSLNPTTDGFKSNAGWHSAGHSYVAWAWDMGDDSPTGFGAQIYTGNGSSQEIRGFGFDPDLVWFKSRSATDEPRLMDTVRGLHKTFKPHSNVAEDSDETTGLVRYVPDGVALGSQGAIQTNNNTYVVWGWDMGTLEADNDEGTIDNAVVKANTTYGQSIVSYEGNETAGATVGHGLNSAPELIIVKNRSRASAWKVYFGDNTDALTLNTDAARDDANYYWNDTSPTSTLITLGGGTDTNGNNENLMAYCWHSVTGYSKIGQYSGTGSNISITTGFRPAWIMVKRLDSAADWFVFDSTRQPFGDANHVLDENIYLNLNNAAGTNNDFCTLSSTGFTVTGTGDFCNNSSGTYLYMAFAGGKDSTSTYNTDGSIDSRVKANTTYGQSIVSYTGTGSNATVGHGLSSAPDMMIVKNKDTDGEAWNVYHTGLGGNDKFLELSASTAVQSNNNRWNNTAPTSSVFSVGTAGVTNESAKEIIAYCFHDVTGYSKIGSYTGNGSATGTVVTTGFKPAWLLIKKTTDEGWQIVDSTRNPNNTLTTSLSPNSNGADRDDLVDVDFTSTGFQLKGTDSSCNADGGTYIYMAFADTREYAYWLDQSGNNNDFTSVNLTESDISVDSPSNNFATLNPLIPDAYTTLSEGNLKIVHGTSFGGQFASQIAESGKWYAEYLVTVVGLTKIGIASANGNLSAGDPQNWSYAFWYNQDGTQRDGTTDSSYGASYTNGDIIGIKLDQDNNTIDYSKNGVYQGSISLSGKGVGTNPTFIGTSGRDATGIWNFGQDSSFAGNKTSQGYQDGNDIGDFFYEPPTGFLALCTKNLPEPTVTPSEHFNNVLWTGNGSSLNITGVGFQPDWVWIKSRSVADSNHLFDSVRGAGQRLRSDTGAVENYNETAYLTSFNSDGFSLGGDDGVNKNTATYWSGSWKAPTSFSNDASATSVGSIDSTGKINVDAGFAIISYTGTGSAATVAHGLSSAPEMLIVKDRDQDMHWFVYHTGLTNANYSVKMDNTQVQANDSSKWNGTDPTSSVFSIGTETGVSESGNKYIAYCFHSVEGYSKVGSYTGNDNANGTFVYCGFEPAYVHINNPNTDGEGFVYMNNKSDPTNVTGTYLTTYGQTGEQGTAGTAFSRSLDFLSNGFKIRGNSTEINDGVVQIFYAVAERPFKYSHAG